MRIERLPESPDDQRQQMAVELAARNSDLDILTLDLVWIGEFARNGWLADLDDFRGQIQKVSLPGPFQSATWKGKLWAAPSTTDAAFLYYRKDLVPTPPMPSGMCIKPPAVIAKSRAGWLRREIPIHGRKQVS